MNYHICCLILQTTGRCHISILVLYFRSYGAFHEAFEQEVDLSVSNLVVSGSPRSGKTASLHLSINEPPPDVRHHSTGCVEKSIHAIAHRTICISGTKMEKLETKEMLDMFCEILKYELEVTMRKNQAKAESEHKDATPVSSILTLDRNKKGNPAMAHLTKTCHHLPTPAHLNRMPLIKPLLQLQIRMPSKYLQPWPKSYPVLKHLPTSSPLSWSQLWTRVASLNSWMPLVSFFATILCICSRSS